MPAAGVLPGRGTPAWASLAMELRRAARRTAEVTDALNDPALTPFIAAIDATQAGLTDPERVRLARIARRAAQR